MNKLARRLQRNLMKLAYLPIVGPHARRMAAANLGPLYGALPLAKLSRRGYVSPNARVKHDLLTMGNHCFIGDSVVVYLDENGSDVELADEVHIHESTILQTGDGGSLRIGKMTHIQPRCQFSAYCGDILIGERVEIAPQCAMYPYNHSMVKSQPIRSQPLFSRAGIKVGDDAWLGFGAVLLDGAHVGEGAVVAAHSVVTSRIPDFAIAAGAPAKVIGERPPS
ncbi:MAG: acyltransferase [Pseudomonadota bacterium]